MADGIRNRNCMADKLSQAADEAPNAELRRQLRALLRTVMADRTASTDAQLDQELIGLAGELLDCVRQGKQAVVQVQIERIEALLPRRAVLAQGGKRMSLFKRISERLGGKPRASMADAACSQADANIFELEKQIAQLSEDRERELDKLRQYVHQAAQYKDESMEYKQLKSRAGLVKKQIAIYESQISAHFTALMNNQRYKQMIASGQAMQGLSDMLPDPAEADVLLEQIAQRTDEVKFKQDAFGDKLREYEDRIDLGATLQTPEDAEFDAAVMAARGEAGREAQPEPAPQGDEAERAASSAGAGTPRDEVQTAADAAEPELPERRAVSEAPEF